MSTDIKPVKRIRKPKIIQDVIQKQNVISLFSGAGGDTLGFERAGYNVMAFSEMKKQAIQTHLAEFPHSTHLVCPTSGSTDITKIPDDVFVTYKDKVDIIFAGFPCFVEDTLVATDTGYKPIQTVTLKDKLLTHTGQFQNIINLQQKHYTGTLYDIKVKYHPDTISCTEEHPFYVREKKKVWNNAIKKYEYVFEEPQWKIASKLTENDYFGMVINSNIEGLNITLDNSDSSFIDGIYVWYAPSSISTRYVENEPVYNFEVDHDNSYVVHNVIVHNCQSFSNAGKKNIDDPRGELVYEFARTVSITHPKWIIGENVPGLLARKGRDPETKEIRPVIDIISDLFKRTGYNITYNVLKATDYGVPQERKRLIIVGCKEENGYPHMPWNNLTPPTSVQHTSVRPILESHLEGAIEFPIENIPTGLDTRFWITTKEDTPTKKPHPNLVRLVQGIRNKSAKEKADNPSDDEKTVITPTGLISFGVRKSPYHGQVLDPDAPSKTIICTYASCPRLFVGLHNPDINKYWVRCLSVKEAGQIQGFPKDYKWCGNEKDIITQIGNAVPPPLCESVIRSLDCIDYKDKPQVYQPIQSSLLDTGDESDSEESDELVE